MGQAIRTRRPWAGRIPARYVPGALILLGLFGLTALENGALTLGAPRLTCNAPSITDGDTFRCDGERVRLTSIDAPEMPGHCREGRTCTPGNPYSAASYLHSITRGTVECRVLDRDVYGRAIGRCRSRGRDLSCAMIEAGHAVPRYGGLSCPAS